MFLTGGDFATPLQPGNVAMSGDNFAQRWGVPPVSSGSEARNIAKHPTMHREAPRKDPPAPDVRSTEVEKPWKRFTGRVSGLSTKSNAATEAERQLCASELGGIPHRSPQGSPVHACRPVQTQDQLLQKNSINIS